MRPSIEAPSKTCAGSIPLIIEVPNSSPFFTLYADAALEIETPRRLLLAPSESGGCAFEGEGPFGSAFTDGEPTGAEAVDNLAFKDRAPRGSAEAFAVFGANSWVILSMRVGVRLPVLALTEGVGRVGVANLGCVRPRCVSAAAAFEN